MIMPHILHSAAIAAERRGSVRAESLLHDGLCHGHRRGRGDVRLLRGDGQGDAGAGHCGGWLQGLAVDGGEGGRGGCEGAGHVGGVGVRGLPRHLADGHVNHSLVLMDLSAGHARLGGSALEMCLRDNYLMDVTTDVSVMEMGLVVDDAKVLVACEAVQVPSLNGEDADGGDRRGGAGEGAAGPAGGNLLRSGQAAVEP